MWLALALVCAFLVGSGDALSKHLLSQAPERVVAWTRVLFSLPWLFLGPLLGGWPPLSSGFWTTVLLMVPLELTAYFSYLRAIRISPLSLTIPFLAFTPLLTVLTGWLFLGERVTTAGFLGVASVTIGAYVLQVERAAEGLLGPIRAIWRTPGIRLMVLTAALYSLTATLSKRAIQLSSAAVFPFIYLSLDALVLTLILLPGAGGFSEAASQVRSSWRLLILAGGLLAGAFFTHSVAIQFVPVAYFIAVKRLSLLVGVLYGVFLFREEAFRQRIAGTALMMAGTLLISVCG